MKLVLTACGVTLALAACAPAPLAVHPPASRPALDAYKKAFALHVLQSTPGVYCQPGEDMLKSVVVLGISVDRAGNLVAAAVVRSNGYPELEQRALESVAAAAPFGAPAAEVIDGSASVEFLETFLFRDDDCFLPRSLAF
jgi:TonB family protein